MSRICYCLVSYSYLLRGHINDHFWSLSKRKYFPAFFSLQGDVVDFPAFWIVLTWVCTQSCCGCLKGNSGWEDTGRAWDKLLSGCGLWSVPCKLGCLSDSCGQNKAEISETIPSGSIKKTWSSTWEWPVIHPVYYRYWRQIGQRMLICTLF